MSGLPSPDPHLSSEIPAPGLPHLLPGFQNGGKDIPKEPSLQVYLSRQYPYQSMEEIPFPRVDATVEWLKKSEAPYLERSFHRGQPLRFEDFLTPSTLAVKCFNTILNQFLSVLFCKQHEFNRQLLRYLKLKDSGPGGH